LGEKYRSLKGTYLTEKKIVILN
jgi:hypothetical protein